MLSISNVNNVDEEVTVEKVKEDGKRTVGTQTPPNIEAAVVTANRYHSFYGANPTPIYNPNASSFIFYPTSLIPSNLWGFEMNHVGDDNGSTLDSDHSSEEEESSSGEESSSDPADN